MDYEKHLELKRRFNRANFSWEKLQLQVQMGHAKEARDELVEFLAVFDDLQKALGPAKPQS
jgi:hypothetical protein